MPGSSLPSLLTSPGESREGGRASAWRENCPRVQKRAQSVLSSTGMGASLSLLAALLGEALSFYLRAIVSQMAVLIQAPSLGEIAKIKSFLSNQTTLLGFATNL